MRAWRITACLAALIVLTLVAVPAGSADPIEPPIDVWYYPEEGVCISGGDVVNLDWCSGALESDSTLSYDEARGVCVTTPGKEPATQCSGPITGPDVCTMPLVAGKAPAYFTLDCSVDSATAFYVTPSGEVQAASVGSVIGEGTPVGESETEYCLLTQPIIVGSQAPEGQPGPEVRWEFDNDCLAIVTAIDPNPPTPAAPSGGVTGTTDNAPPSSIELPLDPAACQPAEEWSGSFHYTVEEWIDVPSTIIYNTMTWKRRYQRHGDHCERKPPSDGTPGTGECWHNPVFPFWSIPSCERGWEAGWPTTPWVSVYRDGHFKWFFGAVEYHMFARVTAYEDSDAGTCMIHSGTIPPGWGEVCYWGTTRVS